MHLQACPNWATTLLLTVLLAFIAYKLLKRGVIVWTHESDMQQAVADPASEVQPLLDNSNGGCLLHAWRPYPVLFCGYPLDNDWGCVMDWFFLFGITWYLCRRLSCQMSASERLCKVSNLAMRHPGSPFECQHLPHA